MEFDTTETTTRIYKGDIEQLKRWQLSLSDARQKWVTLPDLLHEIITEKAGKHERG